MIVPLRVCVYFICHSMGSNRLIHTSMKNQPIYTLYAYAAKRYQFIYTQLHTLLLRLWLQQRSNFMHIPIYAHIVYVNDF